ncbi:MAG: YkvA family protein [bacterium]
MAKKPAGFDSAQHTAEEYAHDREKASYLLEEAEKKAERHKRVLEKVWTDLQSLIRMAKAWIRGEYKEMPWQTIIFAMAGIIYFVNPFDIVPDFLPSVGFLDDATVIGFVLKSIKQDIEEFLHWENGGSTQ